MKCAVCDGKVTECGRVPGGQPICCGHAPEKGFQCRNFPITQTPTVSLMQSWLQTHFKFFYYLTLLFGVKKSSFETWRKAEILLKPPSFPNKLRAHAFCSFFLPTLLLLVFILIVLILSHGVLQWLSISKLWACLWTLIMVVS